MGNDKNTVVDDRRRFDPDLSIRFATFDQYRSLLFSIAYRTLGSVADAEDMLQQPVGGGIVSYEAGGHQRVAVAAGIDSPIWPKKGGSGQIFVFGLK